MSIGSRRRDQALTGTMIVGAGADDDVDRRPVVSGLPARPTPTMRPSRMPMRGLADAEHRVDDDDVGDHDVARLLGTDGPQPMPSRAVLPNP